MAKPLTETQIAMIKAVEAEYERVLEDIGPVLAESDTPMGVKQAVVAQNVIRLCMEVVLKRMLPFDEILVGELAIRLASYAISAAPFDQGSKLIRAVEQNLRETHKQRMSQGIMISTAWEVPK